MNPTQQLRRTGLGIVPSLVVSLLLLVLLLTTLGILPATAAPAATVISPADMQGWSFLVETPNGSGDFVVGPNPAPIGIGSARLQVDASGGLAFGAAVYTNTPFSAITVLTYTSYHDPAAGGSTILAPSLQFNVDYDLTDADSGWQGRLVFEPYLTPGNTPAKGVWQTWDALAGRWWASGAPGNSVCPHSAPCPLSTLLASFPNAGIHGPFGAVLFKAGGGWAGGFIGYIDDFNITVGGVPDRYNFEPYLPVRNVTQGSDHPTIQDAINLANPGDVISAAAGIYVENVVIDKQNLTLIGAGAGPDSAHHTILDGSTLGTASGIHIDSGITGVTIEHLRVQNYTTSGFGTAGIYATGSNDDFTLQHVHVYSNTNGAAGLYMNGPVDNVLIDNVQAYHNSTRGIVIWNGVKTNIALTNNDARYNNCCGIELQDGTASGVTMTGNIATGNADSGMSAIGLTAGAGPNLIANNLVQDNGRFGIEIKLPDGTGLESGDGSIVVRDNVVSLTPAPAMNARDHAGIAVFRRSWSAGNGYADIPTGVVVRDNTVSGYRQVNPASSSEGFGIVVEGTGMTVISNTVTGSDVGIQVQAGHQPYAPFSTVDGDQSDLADQFFGRGNSPVGCALSGANAFAGNGTDFRRAGLADPPVTNVNTGITFCDIQSAIDNFATADGQTLALVAATYTTTAQIVVNKSLTITGVTSDTTLIRPAFNTGSSGDARGWFLVDTGANVHFRNLTMDGSGRQVFQAIRHKGEGSIDGVTFRNIRYSQYLGMAVVPFGTGPVDISNCLFANIERLGVLYFGAGVNGSVFSGNRYEGKGDGDFLDYGVELGGGAVVTVTNSVIFDNRGVASSDGSTSAGVLATTYYGTGTAGTIADNRIMSSTTAVSVGYDSADTTVLTARGNHISHVDTAFFLVTGTLTAYANNVEAFVTGVISSGGTLNGRYNWWGDISPANVGDPEAFDYRLGAPVLSYDFDPRGDVSHANAFVDSLVNAGTAVIVNHGRLASSDPFDRGFITDTADLCSNYYDIFLVEGGSGDYQVGVTVDDTLACRQSPTGPRRSDSLFAYDRALASCSPAPGCYWDQVPGTNHTNDSVLATVTAAYLTGTPFVAGPRAQTPQANDDGYVTPDNVPLQVSAGGVLANDVDGDSATLTSTLLVDVNVGALALQLDGSFIYTPVLDSLSVVSFTYTANDGVLTDTAVVTITVTCGVPVAVSDVAISRSGADVILNWTAVAGASGYKVHRGTTPYFMPDAATLLASPSTAAYTDIGAIGLPGTNYYYRVLAERGCGTLSGPSNETAEFDFAIVPGS